MRSPGEGTYRAARIWVTKAAALAFLFVAALALSTNFVSAYSMDFVSYWAAGKLTLAGAPEASYNLHLHRAVELEAVRLTGRLPFPYAPPYLLLVAPFGLLPYPAAAVAWLGSTFALYLYAIRRLAPTGGWIAAAFPPVLTNAIIGQNGFLTCGLLAGGMALLAKRPFLGGMVLGALILKPQLGLLLPLVLVAGRERRAFAGAAVSSLGLLLIGAALFGVDAYRAWLDQAPVYASIVTEGLSGWHRMASVYAAVRMAGLEHFPALTIHVSVAAVAAAAACLVWRHGASLHARAASLAAATALASPYFYGYDTLILILPFVWLAGEARDRPWLVPVWCLSLGGLLLNWSGGQALNLAPLTAMILLALVCRRALSEIRQHRQPPADLGPVALRPA